MGLLQEFRQFALRGSAMDIGVGVVVGAAFSSFVNSFVKDILLPPIGYLYSKINLQQLYFVLNGDKYPSLEKAQEAGATTINYVRLVYFRIHPIYDYFICGFYRCPANQPLEKAASAST